MADVAITPTTLVLNTASADILDTDGVALASTDNEFVIAAGGLGGDRLLLKFWDDGSGCTVTFVQGDRPPSQRAELGATGTDMPTGLDITLAANDVRYIVVEASRFLHDDGKIRVTGTDTGLECKAFILPKVA